MSTTVTRLLTRDLATAFNYGTRLRRDGGVIAGLSAYAQRQKPATWSNIIARVDKDLYSEDRFGEAFPSGQLWVSDFPYVGDSDGNSAEIYTLRNGIITGTITSARSWAVPASIDTSFYTVNNDRNNRPVRNMIEAYSSVPVTGDRFKAIRTADSLYAPMEINNNSVWAPCANGMNGDAFAGTMTHGIAGDPDTTPALSSNSIGFDSYNWVPGYRAIRLIASTNFDPATYVTPAFGSITVKVYAQTVWNAGTLVATGVISGAFTYDPAVGAYVLDVGVIGVGNTHPHGEARKFLTYMESSVANVWPIQIQVWCSPRLDIPFCWTATSDHPTIADGLIAPGGILKGTVPGF